MPEIISAHTNISIFMILKSESGRYDQRRLEIFEQIMNVISDKFSISINYIEN